VKKDSLGKLYDRFRAHERFRLAIEALVREDEEEVNRLRDTCPREIYRMTELAYRERVRMSWKMTMIFCLDLAPRLAKLKMVEAFRETLPYVFNYCEDEAILAYLDGYEAGSRRAWETAGKEGAPPGWGERDEGYEEDEDPVIEEDLDKITARLARPTTRFIALLEELECSITKDALTVWAAFANFCKKELLLEPEKLLKAWFEPMLPEVEKLRDLPDPPEVNLDELKEYEAALKRGWEDLLGES
jgi:hypothetical protein